MRHQLLRIFCFFLPLLASVALLGCYTQVGGVRSEKNPDRDYDRPEATEREYTTADDSSSYNQNEEDYNNDDYGYRHRWLGFDYYYPTVVIGASVWDPWYWDRWGSYTYSPFWCGTYYPGIYAGWYYPRYYTHYPNYYGGYYGGHNKGHRGDGYYGGTRTIGNTRGGTVRGFGSVRGTSGGTQVPASPSGELPRGYRAASPDRAKPSSAMPKVSTGRRDGSVRGSSNSGTVGRGGSTRGGGSREGKRLERPGGSSGPSYSPPPRDSNRGGSRGGGERSYTPPPASSAPSSAPSGSHGGGAPSRGDSGGRGGSRR